MNKPLSVAALLICAVQAYVAPGDAIAISGNGTPAPIKVLIVKDESYLEDAVTKILRDSLGRKGFTVETTSLKKLVAENPPGYRTVAIADFPVSLLRRNRENE